MSNLENLNQQDFIKAKQIFTEAVKLDQDLINDYVKSQCEDNQPLLDAVVSLVNMHLDSGEKTIIPKKPLSELINKTHNITEGQKIGKFVIEKTLGSGGMGDVYLAKRSDNEVQQKVAIKVLKNKLNQSAFERFQTEKRLLAHLEHPGIARLIDAGVTDDGMTYYVMEYVEGQSIDEYCEHKQLTVKQRLKLFMDVCDVVSYAHGNLIIHRDLKPQNILVTDKCQVKLLDFGIAKPLQQLPGMEELPQTMQGSFALTPQYAAPEQFSDGVIGTACDVYALGLLLYELLTGTLAQDLTGLSLAQMEKIITDKVFVNASKQVTQQNINTEQFQLKNTIQLKSLLKGDIDSIINQAIKKEPQQRYKSVADLAQDIDNHLNFKPISVRGNQQAYRLKKYLRRNWLPVTASIGLITILSLSTYFVGLERDKAIQKKQLAEEVSSFLVSTFKNADPTKTQGEKITAKEILEEGVRQIDNQQDSQIKDKLLLTMGEVYYELAEYSKSLNLINQTKIENNELILLQSKNLNQKGDHIDALKKISKFQFIEGTEEELSYLSLKSNILRNSDRFNEAENIAVSMLQKAEIKFGKNSIEYANYLMDFSTVSNDIANRSRNIKNLKKVIEVYEGNNIKNDFNLARAHQILSLEYSREESLEKSLYHLKKSEQINKLIFGDEHLIIGYILNNAGNTNLKLKKYKDAINNYKKSIAIKEKYFGSKDDFRFSATYFNIGLVYSIEGLDFERAIFYMEKALNLLEQRKDLNKNRYNYFRKSLSLVFIKTKQYDKAEKILKELIPYYINMKYKIGKNLAETRMLLAFILFEKGNSSDAKKLFDVSFETIRKNFKTTDRVYILMEGLNKKLIYSF